MTVQPVLPKTAPETGSVGELDPSQPSESTLARPERVSAARWPEEIRLRDVPPIPETARRCMLDGDTRYIAQINGADCHWRLDASGAVKLFVRHHPEHLWPTRGVWAEIYSARSTL